MKSHPCAAWHAINAQSMVTPFPFPSLHVVRWLQNIPAGPGSRRTWQWSTVLQVEVLVLPPTCWLAAGRSSVSLCLRSLISIRGGYARWCLQGSFWFWWSRIIKHCFSPKLLCLWMLPILTPLSVARPPFRKFLSWYLADVPRKTQFTMWAASLMDTCFSISLLLSPSPSHHYLLSELEQ